MSVMIFQSRLNVLGLIYLIKFVAGSNKGGIKQGDVFNDPFRLGKVDPQYTSSRVTKDLTVGSSTTSFTMEWKPVVAGTITITAGGKTYVDDGAGKLIEVKAGYSVSRRTVMVQPVDDIAGMGDMRLEGVQPTVETVVTDASGDPVEATAGTIDYAAGTITFTSGVEGAVQIAYSYKFVVA